MNGMTTQYFFKEYGKLTLKTHDNYFLYRYEYFH